jgi:hypothetical protein
MKWWIGLYQARSVMPKLKRERLKKGDHSYQMHTKSGGDGEKFKKSSSSSPIFRRNPKEMDPSRSKKLGARPTLTPRT